MSNQTLKCLLHSTTKDDKTLKFLFIVYYEGSKVNLDKYRNKAQRAICAWWSRDYPLLGWLIFKSPDTPKQRSSILGSSWQLGWWLVKLVTGLQTIWHPKAMCISLALPLVAYVEIGKAFDWSSYEPPLLKSPSFPPFELLLRSSRHRTLLMK